VIQFISDYWWIGLAAIAAVWTIYGIVGYCLEVASHIGDDYGGQLFLALVCLPIALGISLVGFGWIIVAIVRKIAAASILMAILGIWGK
jgi:hypothetical protein